MKISLQKVCCILYEKSLLDKSLCLSI